MLPEMPQEIGSKTNIWGHSDQELAHHSEAVLAVVVILAGDLVFSKFGQEI